MAKAYLLKILLCEAIDRLKSAEHFIDALPELSDDELLRLLENTARMMNAVKNASERCKDHRLACELAQNLVQKEALTRGLIDTKNKGGIKNGQKA